jgi:hypothetical protein
VKVRAALVTGSVAVVDTHQRCQPFRIVLPATSTFEKMPVQKVDDVDGDTAGSFVGRLCDVTNSDRISATDGCVVSSPGHCGGLRRSAQEQLRTKLLE